MNPATMTPEQLAEAGIPATVALRARVKEAEQQYERVFAIGDVDECRRWYIRQQERRDALAILEAQGKP
jgi:hypothetical protein